MRQIEIVVPSEARGRIEEALEGQPVLDAWTVDLGGGRLLTKALIETEKTEALLDRIEKAGAGLSPFRVVLLPVEGTIPRPPDPEPSPAAAPALRVSRAELYADVEKSARVTWVFLTLVVLSSVVAAVGLVRDNGAVLIGAMVIAPLLGPNVALSLATTLGDLRLAGRAVRASAAGMALALAFSVIVGTTFPFDPSVEEIRSRTDAGPSDILLALASGAAGALAFTTGAPASLIGVMVAVALLPPLVACGMLLGGGRPDLAGGAALLLATNVVCVNLAGVATFLLQGIRPARWWEAERARRGTRTALLLWTLALALLALLVYLVRPLSSA